MEHKFTGPPYTIGIEEEMMILDAESFELVNAIESLLEPAPAGEIKPELMEAVLEVSTDPCQNTVQAGEQLRALRAQVREAAARKDLTIGSAGKRLSRYPFEMLDENKWLAARHGLDGELVDHDLREVMAEVVAATLA
jgi:glutamate---cysteine ligase / carboxylate-amine ligase